MEAMQQQGVSRRVYALGARRRPRTQYQISDAHAFLWVQA